MKSATNPKRETWSFLWAYESESRDPTKTDTCWKNREYKGTFEQCCAKIARFLSSRGASVELDYEARNDTPGHRYNRKKHQRTFPNLYKHPLLGEYVH